MRDPDERGQEPLRIPRVSPIRPPQTLTHSANSREAEMTLRIDALVRRADLADEALAKQTVLNRVTYRSFVAMSAIALTLAAAVVLLAVTR